MARLFDDGSSDYLQVEQPAVTAYPFAMVCWFRSNDADAGQALIWIGDKDHAETFTALQARGDQAGDKIWAYSHRYGEADDEWAVSASGYTVDTWHHAAGIWLSTTERHAYIDGGNKGSDTDEVGAMVNHNRTAIGACRDSTPGAYMSGDIAEVAIWDLTDWGANDAAREIAFEKAIISMAKGFSPNHFPLGLKAHWPLIRGLNDKVEGYNLTASGTAVSNHPRVILPHGII